MPCWVGYQNLQVGAQKASCRSSWSVMYLGCLWYFYYVRWPGEYYGWILCATFAFPPIVAWSLWNLSLVWTWLELYRMVGNPVALSRMQSNWWNSWSCIWYSSSGARWGLMTICVRIEERHAVTSWMTLTCAITEVSPRSGGAASVECWRAIFSTSCYPHIVPMMNGWLVKRFVLHLYIFHLYLIINKNTEKGMYLVIQERFSSNIWYVTIFCEYPVSLKLLLNILYPNNFFLKYPVSRKPLMGPHSLSFAALDVFSRYPLSLKALLRRCFLVQTELWSDGKQFIFVLIFL